MDQSLRETSFLSENMFKQASISVVPLMPLSHFKSLTIISDENYADTPDGLVRKPTTDDLNPGARAS